MSNNIECVKTEQCCGCSACYSKCPVGAITMHEDNEGFLKPVIDENKCTNCGLCTKACPVLNPKYENTDTPECYAAMAETKIRMKSSSGGVFTLLAEYVLDKGGSVCGAAYDEEWTVHHIIIDKKEDLDKVRKSKYMQSRVEDCYKQIKNLLDNDKYVLFGGTPCQVAGLNNYLGKKYEKLITIDVVCHGVPSPKVFRKFLQENNPVQKVISVDFREKEVLGWTTPTVVKYENGEVYRRAFNECSYFRGFLANMFLNKPCGDCPFNKIPRQGDFTLGDFWMIHEYNKEYTDGKGTGIVLLNNKKAEEIFELLKPQLTKLCKKVPMEFALKSNPNLICSFKHHKNRDKFFEYFKKYPYEEAFKRANNEKFDVCVVGLGWWPNYGAALTNFAFIKTLEDLNKSVIMFNRPVEEINRDDISINFAKKHFNLSLQYSKLSVHELNEKAESFIVGSDQLWHWNVLRVFPEYMLLGFVHSNRRKIAYASSFGHNKFNAPPLYKYIFSYLLSRFNAVSVREISGLKILKEMGIKGSHVLDPVFMCNPEHLIKLAETVKPRKNEKYIFSYILDPFVSGNKKELLLKISQKYNLSLLNHVDMHDEKRYEKDLGLPIEKNLSIEEFISNLYHSEYVVTDSFHGVCFSIIFRKKFICIGNPWRGIARFESLLTKLGLLDRMLYHCEEWAEKEGLLNQDIDYDSVFEILAQEKEHSMEFLKNALNSPINSDGPTDSFDALNVKMWQNLIEMWERDKKIKDTLKVQTSLKGFKASFRYQRYRFLSKIMWGKKREHYRRKYQELKRLKREYQ